MINKTKQHRILLTGNMHISNPPYYEFEGKLTYDTDISEEDDHAKGCYVADYDIRFQILYLDEPLIFQRVIRVDVSRYHDIEQMLKRATLLAFKNYCYDWYFENNDLPDPDTMTKRELNIVGLTNHHTFEKLWHHACSFLVTDKKISIYNGAEEEYNISLSENNDRQIATYFQNIFTEDKSDFSDLLEALWNLPDYFKENYLESEQRQEAVRRLRILGVSEEEIEDFETNGIIPVVEDSPNEIRHGKAAEFHGMFYMRQNDSFVPLVCSALYGNLPYLIFDSRGVIPMVAILYVEDKREDTVSYQMEFKENRDELVLTALGAAGGKYGTAMASNCTEYGSIVVKLTKNGPERIG